MACRILVAALVAGCVQANPQKCVGMPQMALIEKMAPDCIETCLNLCGPMNGIVEKYMKTLSQDLVKPLICASASEFDCLFDNMDVCGTLQEKAKAAGIMLLGSGAELLSECKNEGLPIDTDDESKSGDDASKSSDADGGDKHRDLPVTSAALGGVAQGGALGLAFVVSELLRL
mmetsp:Transcript_60870/g.168440  ORF Transcript_60870/g.168440 Transcript_60870/m.168440 type:complete len:174 (+) Transcript_60870:68-589(+)